MKELVLLWGRRLTNVLCARRMNANRVNRAKLPELWAITDLEQAQAWINDPTRGLSGEGFTPGYKRVLLYQWKRRHQTAPEPEPAPQPEPEPEPEPKPDVLILQPFLIQFIINTPTAQYEQYREQLRNLTRDD